MNLKLFLSLFLSIGVYNSIANVENSISFRFDYNDDIEEFTNKLSKGEKLSSFFKDGWEFVYHQDDRCNGSTDGTKANLQSEQIDEVIKIKVINDGEGWACDKRESSEFILDFSLQKKVKDWDRFEIASDSKPGKGEYFIWGSGASDYLKIYLREVDGKKLIVKLEYRSEDPG